MNPEHLAAMGQYNMIERGDQVWAAVSGGADSVVLLHLLRRLERPMGFTLRAMHLNHNLRGEESRGDERFVRGLCRRMGVELAVASLPVARLAGARGISVEECARTVRYAFFDRCAGTRGKIATAHTASDTAETVLFNLARGTGLRGLCGIPPVRGNIVRPLIDWSRQEVEAYCARHHLPFVTDSSNNTDDYTRNRLRHHVVPVLREQNPKLERSVAAMCRALRADEDYLEREAQEVLTAIDLGQGRFDSGGYLRADEALRPRILRALLRGRGVGYGRERMMLMEAVIRRGSGAVQLSGAWTLAAAPGSFSLREIAGTAAPAPRWAAIPLPLGGEGAVSVDFGGRLVRITILSGVEYEKNKNIRQNQFKNLLDCDRIEKIVNLRHRNPGDKIRLAGRGCTKAVRRLMGEAGIPPERRDRMLVLSDSKGPLWVEGFGAAEAACATPQTRRVALIEVEDQGVNA